MQHLRFPSKANTHSKLRFQTKTHAQKLEKKKSMRESVKVPLSEVHILVCVQTNVRVQTIFGVSTGEDHVTARRWTHNAGV